MPACECKQPVTSSSAQPAHCQVLPQGCGAPTHTCCTLINVYSTCIFVCVCMKNAVATPHAVQELLHPVPPEMADKPQLSDQHLLSARAAQRKTKLRHQFGTNFLSERCSIIELLNSLTERMIAGMLRVAAPQASCQWLSSGITSCQWDSAGPWASYTQMKCWVHYGDGTWSLASRSNRGCCRNPGKWLACPSCNTVAPQSELCYRNRRLGATRGNRLNRTC